MGVSDHPRSRGVYQAQSTANIQNQGSSPLARGLRTVHRTVQWCTRIIPARAGFTMMVATASSPCPDHPRSRGVYRPHRNLSLSWWGSSPLARGLPHSETLALLEDRIIPARAGFTRWHTRHSPQRRDHPRSRGVYFHSEEKLVKRAGSSPLARGLLCRCRRLN